MDTLTNAESNVLMMAVNSLPFITKRIIKRIAELASKINNYPLLEPYIRPLLVLLSNIINIKGNSILRELKPKFEEKLVGYAFYIDEILSDTIDISATEFYATFN